MLHQLDNFYAQQPEPIRGCLLALRQIILAQDKDITAAFKYGMPFFCYQGKMFCYLWIHKKQHCPYLGIVEGKHIHHPLLIQEKRARMKTMLFNPAEDLPIDTIRTIIQQAIDLYKKGVVKIP
jgi:hypothetical protein